MVDLLDGPMNVQRGSLARLDGGLSQALITIAVHTWMHEFPNLAAVFRSIRLEL